MSALKLDIKRIDFKMADSSGIDSIHRTLSSCPPYPYSTNQNASIHLTLPRSRLHRGSPTLCSICRVCFFFRVIMHAGRAFAAGLVKRRKGGVHLSPLLSIYQSAFRPSVAINPFNDHPLNGLETILGV